MSRATLTGGPRTFSFRVNPNKISLSYNLRTSTQNTYAGKVIQILGINIEGLTVTSDAGRGGRKHLRKVLLYCRDLVKWQKNNESPVTFNFPSQKIKLKVFLKSFTLNDRIENDTFPFTLDFVVQEDVSGVVTKNTLADELGRLAEGIGYDNDSVFVNPEATENEPPPLTPEEGAYTGGTGEAGGDVEGGGGVDGPAPPAGELGQAIIRAAEKYLGLKYVWGGGGFNGPTNGGFDCSGLTQYAVYQGSGKKIKINRTAHEQQKNGVGVSKDQMAPGDLVMFTKKGSSRAHHVVIYIGNGQVLHAPRTGDVVKRGPISAWRNEKMVVRRMTY